MKARHQQMVRSAWRTSNRAAQQKWTALFHGGPEPTFSFSCGSSLMRRMYEFMRPKIFKGITIRPLHIPDTHA